MSTALDLSSPSKGKAASLNSNNITASLDVWPFIELYFVEYFWYSFSSHMLSQAAGVIIQGEVWLCPVLCEGPDGEATAAHPRVQEIL